MKKIYLILFTVIFTAALSVIGCDAPLASFDTTAINQVKDANAPVVTVTSPEAGGPFSSTVLVEGLVSDTGVDGDGGIKSVVYEVLNTEINGAAELNDDGGFTFSFRSRSGGAELSGQISIRITAYDWNDNPGTLILTLNNEAGAFGYFEAEAGNGSVALNWKEVPLSEAFTVYYTDDGSVPSEAYGTAISVPSSVTADSEGIYSYTIDGLENGDLYRFRIEAACNDGRNNLSAVSDVIPLSPYYLYPSVTSGYRSNSLDWLSMEGADSYRVYRSTDPDGAFEDVSGLISRTEFTDKNLTPDCKYYYRIAPSLEGGIMSAAACGVPTGMKTGPEIIGSLSSSTVPEGTTSDELLEIITEGDYAYGLYKEGGLAVFNIEDPAEPRQLYSHLYEEDGAHYYTYGKLATYEGYLYVSCCSIDIYSSPDTLLIYSLETQNGTPEEPALVNSLQPGFINDFVPYNNRLYIGSIDEQDIDDSNDDTAVVNVLDINSPAEATVASDLTKKDLEITNLTIEGMTVHNGELYFSNRWFYSSAEYLYICSLESPAEPSIIAQTTDMPKSHSGGVQVVGEPGAETAYVLGAGKRFEVLNVSDPTTSIPEISSYNDLASDPQGMVVSGGYAYITYSSGVLQILGLNGNKYYDGSDTTFPIPECAILATNGKAQDIALHEGCLWIANGIGGLLSVEAAGFGTVEKSTTEVVLYKANTMAAAGDLAYVADGLEGVKILDISTPAGPSEIGSVEPVTGSNNGITDVAVHGDYLYAACHTSAERAGLFIYDMTDPLNPRDAGTALSIVQKIDVRGSYLYAVSQNLLFILNVEDPENPLPVSSVSIEGAFEVKVQGDYAYVLHPSTISAVNISNPRQPRITGSCSIGCSDGASLVLTEEYAFIGYDKLFIVNISNPENLDNDDRVEDGDSTDDEGWSFWSAAHTIYGMDTDGRYLYMSVCPAGTGATQKLAVLDCLNIFKPALIAETEVGTNGRKFCLLNGNTVYVGAESGIVRTFTLSQ